MFGSGSVSVAKSDAIRSCGGRDFLPKVFSSKSCLASSSGVDSFSTPIFSNNSHRCRNSWFSGLFVSSVSWIFTSFRISEIWIWAFGEVSWNARQNRKSNLSESWDFHWHYLIMLGKHYPLPDYIRLQLQQSPVQKTLRLNLVWNFGNDQKDYV